MMWKIKGKNTTASMISQKWIIESCLALFRRWAFAKTLILIGVGANLDVTPYFVVEVTHLL